MLDRQCQQYGPDSLSACFPADVVLEDMVYGEAVARETLRVHSPVPFVYRRALVDLEVGGYTIPKVCSLLVLLTSLISLDHTLQGASGRCLPSEDMSPPCTLHACVTELIAIPTALCCSQACHQIVQSLNRWSLWPCTMNGCCRRQL